MFKKKKKKSQKKKEKLASEAVAPKLHPLTIIYAIFVLSPGVILGDRKERAKLSLPGCSTAAGMLPYCAL